MRFQSSLRDLNLGVPVPSAEALGYFQLPLWGTRSREDETVAAGPSFARLDGRGRPSLRVSCRWTFWTGRSPVTTRALEQGALSPVGSDAEMFVGELGRYSTARRAVEEADLDEEGFVYFFDGVGLFGQGRA